ncbi:retropepsin-like aspartic protease family protein [Sulfurovum riftiae]|uniref:Peptidase A2 domain-containing protein n=1 Tax=Sulfurovum riftiae TaxID=1630136 RepID=A0A151CFZ8_9BACT|nr:retropepsin-like aspartic protease [Sulfurovum riftiae]KYJ86446.1 hypothetical protein AS592_06465 [Sulfurovum riftiae]
MKFLLAALPLLFISANAEDILLTKRGGVFDVPGVINGKVDVEFTVDSGAGMVYISEGIFKKLQKLGTISRTDIIGRGKSRIANGDLVDILLINLKTLKIGQSEIKNVKAGVGGNGASILLGQSALKRFEPWHIDTKRGILSITSDSKRAKMYVSSAQGISRSEALMFVNHYLTIEKNRDIGALYSLYADKVDYLGKKNVLKRDILSQKEAYYRKWQHIDINMIKFISSKNIPHHPERTEVKYSTMFKLRNNSAQKGKSGQAMNTMVLEKRENTIRIISENVKILSRHSY